MKERELYPPIFQLFSDYVFHEEVGVGHRSRTTKTIDLVGLPIGITHDTELISIEVKISDWKKVFRQALDNLFYVNLSYVALPEKCVSKVDLTVFESEGVGVVSVNGVAKEILPACHSTLVRTPKRNCIIETCMKRGVHVPHA